MQWCARDYLYHGLNKLFPEDTMGDNTNIIVDHSASHSSVVLPAIQGLYEQGILTDCQLEIGGKKLACHRLLLAVCSPVPQAMLTSGMTEAQTCIIPIELFGVEVIQAIVL